MVLPDGSRSLSEGMLQQILAPAGSTEPGSCQGIGFALPAAPLTVSAPALDSRQEGRKPLSFQNVNFWVKDPLTNRIVVYDTVAVTALLIITG